MTNINFYIRRYWECVKSRRNREFALIIDYQTQSQIFIGGGGGYFDDTRGWGFPSFSRATPGIQHKDCICYRRQFYATLLNVQFKAYKLHKIFQIIHPQPVTALLNYLKRMLQSTQAHLHWELRDFSKNSLNCLENLLCLVKSLFLLLFFSLWMSGK